MIKQNKKIMIHAYKRNGWLYRVWEYPEVLESNEKFTVVSLMNSKVITNEKNSKRNFISKNIKNSFWFFFKDKWYNIIATITTNNVVNFYINIASPFIYEEEAIKYYDFDLDIKMKSNTPLVYKVLDVDEYEEHRIEYHYEPEIEMNCQRILNLFKSDEFRQKIINFISPKMLTYLSKKRKGN